MIITDINTGMCEARASENRPCFMLQWKERGQPRWKFFATVSGREGYKRALEKFNRPLTKQLA